MIVVDSSQAWHRSLFGCQAVKDPRDKGPKMYQTHPRWDGIGIITSRKNRLKNDAMFATSKALQNQNISNSIKFYNFESEVLYIFSQWAFRWVSLFANYVIWWYRTIYMLFSNLVVPTYKKPAAIAAGFVFRQRGGREFSKADDKTKPARRSRGEAFWVIWRAKRSPGAPALGNLVVPTERCKLFTYSVCYLCLIDNISLFKGVLAS